MVVGLDVETSSASVVFKQWYLVTDDALRRCVMSVLSISSLFFVASVDSKRCVNASHPSFPPVRFNFFLL